MAKRIYLAGLYHSRGTKAGQTTANMEVSLQTSYPWVLESYYYLKLSPSKVKVIRDAKQENGIFLDSGAFSAFTKNLEIPLEEYAGFIKTNADMLHVSSNLDFIGKGEEAAAKSYANLKALEKLGAKVMPVHHARDPDRWLQRYLAEGYDYIFLGGMVPETRPWLKEWLDHVWSAFLVNKDGSPKVKVHGFGLTTNTLMFRYPWFSVDSTGWVMTGRYGLIYIDLPQPDGSLEMFKLNLSTESGSRFDLDRHYDTLPKPLQKRIRDRVEEFGYKIDDLRQMYGWRDRWNIDYFRRMMDRHEPVFKDARSSLISMLGDNPWKR